MIGRWTDYNLRFGATAAVTPPKILREIERNYPVASVVKATALSPLATTYFLP